MNKKLKIYLFVLLAIIQLAIPAVMIAKRELVLKNGKAFKFATAPVDPYDAFRGRYVHLNFKNNYAPLKENLKLNRDQRGYAHLKKDSNGFARIDKFTLTPPEDNDYLKVKVRYIDRNRNRIYFELPFNRYYLEESTAKLAEKYYQGANQNQDISSYVVVRVDNGFAVLEDLYLEGEPILDYIENRLNE